MSDLKLDEGLKDIFSGEDRPLHPDTVHVTLGCPRKAAAGKAAIISKKETVAQAEDQAVDAHRERVEEKPGQMDRLKQCAKSVLCFGCLSLLFFFWQQTGQMAMTASMPCILVCAALAGFRVGRAFGVR